MRYVHFKLVGPAIAAIALLIAGMGIFPYFGISRADGEVRAQQEALVARNIALWISDVEFSLTAWTIWDEAIVKIDNAFDFEWTDRNIGASLIGTSRTRFVAILDAGNAMVYSRTDDEVKERPFFSRGSAAIAADAMSLANDVRRREGRPSQDGIPAPIAVSRMEVMGEEAVLLTATLFQPDFRTARTREDRAPILITAMPISGTLQDFFGTRFLLDDAQITPLSAVTPERAHADIATGPGGEIQVLSWRAPTPAADALYQSLPLVVTIAIVLLGCGAFALSVSRTTATKLMAREQQMRHAAGHDFLTGLANRSMLEREYKRQVRNGPLTVVCVDLDGFKGINDTFGHATGDALLKVVADRLRGGTREADRLFRLGGDEFAILMPAMSLDDAESICQRLSASLAMPVELPAGGVVIGASFGLRLVEDDTTDCDEALRSADAALYRAKARGRGAVMAAVSADRQQDVSDAA